MNLKFFDSSQSWIPRAEQTKVVLTLLRLGLLKFDNTRSLPLKMGGTTDVYINLRDARNNPMAIKYLSELFADPVSRISPDRFVEVPDSVSCFAGPLAIDLEVPYLTIREEAKEGRVAKGKVIGKSNRGESVCIIDDVITDGASKVVPLKECRDLGLNVEALVVLVDRQQGWRKTLTDVSVWSGMTLHDVRRELVMSGEMERCSIHVEEKNPIIVALDGKSWDEILPIVDRLRTTGCILKVNDLVFDEGMSHLLPELSVYGRVMVDLKLHEISNTVENTLKRLAKHNVWAVTVHASGGSDMVKAAVETLKNTSTKVLAITALTSLRDKDCERIYASDSLTTVRRLAHEAFSAGAHGIVCSPREVKEVRADWPDKVYVTPGVRSLGVAKGDQARDAMPKEAIQAGATHIVMGRQILGAEDPVLEVSRVLYEELEIVL